MTHRSSVLLAQLVCSLVGVGLSACNATETGNPVTQQTLALEARSSNDDVSSGASSSASIRVESAWIVLGDMRFVSSADCDRGEGSRVDFKGPIAIDLVEQSDDLELMLDATQYCRVRVKLDKAKDVSGAPSELDDQSIVLQGTRADGTSFSVKSQRNFNLELRARGDAFSLAATRGSMILAFDLATWLDSVDLEGAAPDASGAIEVDDHNDKDRLDVFEDNVKRAMELYRDRDGNSKLDDDELGDPLAGGA
jgi:hypothetical protein